MLDIVPSIVKYSIDTKQFEWKDTKALKMLYHGNNPHDAIEVLKSSKRM